MVEDDIQAKEEGIEDSTEVRYHDAYQRYQGYIIDWLPSAGISLIIKRP